MKLEIRTPDPKILEVLDPDGSATLLAKKHSFLWYLGGEIIKGGNTHSGIFSSYEI
jgi:hypothetical protein